MKTKEEAIKQLLEEDAKFGLLLKEHEGDTEYLCEADHLYQEGVIVNDIVKIFGTLSMEDDVPGDTVKREAGMTDKEKIASRNDAFRRRGLGVDLSQGVEEIGDVEEVLQMIREFDGFTKENDPHGEHDHGTVEWEGEEVFWKIGYFDVSLNYWESPLCQNCRRVLTVMLESEL